MTTPTSAELTRTIKTALARAFPDVAFEVRSKPTEVQVRWSDKGGPGVGAVMDALIEAGCGVAVPSGQNGESRRLMAGERSFWLDAWYVAKPRAERRAKEQEAPPRPRQASDEEHEAAPRTPRQVTYPDMADLLGQLSAGLKAHLAGREATHQPAEMAMLEWRDKRVPPIRPNMTSEQITELLQGASGNAWIKRMVALWQQLGSPGRVQVRKSATEGRSVHVMGLRPVAEGWRGIPTLITDATADPVLLRYIWPDLKCEVSEWEQLPRPAGVRVFQTVDRSQSMDRIGVFGEGEKLARRQDAARRVWAALLVRALEYGGQSVGVILYKSTREWIEQNCFVPPWFTLLHHGSVAGVNSMERVRALFVVGRLLPSAETVTKMAEALTGEYLPEREYRWRQHAGRILIPQNADGYNVVRVDVWEHPHPIAERIRRQTTEAGAVQNEGRARASLRDETSPLDIHRWHDVPLPELGEVEPLLWDEVKAGLDGVMLAAGGVWLENTGHAAKAYPSLMTVRGLRDARQNSEVLKPEAWPVPSPQESPASRGGNGSPIRDSNRETVTSSPFRFAYQLAGAGQKPASGVSLLGEAEARAFLVARLGALKAFERAKG